MYIGTVVLGFMSLIFGINFTDQVNFGNLAGSLVAVIAAVIAIRTGISSAYKTTAEGYKELANQRAVEIIELEKRVTTLEAENKIFRAQPDLTEHAALQKATIELVGRLEIQMDAHDKEATARHLACMTAIQALKS